MNRRLRLARLEDTDALLAIYAPYVLETCITFEYAVPCRDEFAGRLRRTGGDYPWLVLEEEGRITGYAYAARHMERAAYQWNAVLSVYMDRARTGRGGGRALYGALLDLLAMQASATPTAASRFPTRPAKRSMWPSGSACWVSFPLRDTRPEAGTAFAGTAGV